MKNSMMLAILVSLTGASAEAQKFKGCKESSSKFEDREVEHTVTCRSTKRGDQIKSVDLCESVSPASGADMIDIFLTGEDGTGAPIGFSKDEFFQDGKYLLPQAFESGTAIEFEFDTRRGNKTGWFREYEVENPYEIDPEKQKRTLQRETRLTCKRK